MKRFLCLILLAMNLSHCASVDGSIYTVAKAQEGGFFRRGQSFQCANWVASVARKAGKSLPKNHGMARSWLRWGKPVSFASKQPGDVIVLWRGSPRSKSGHILIYAGNGQAIHRSTYRSPIERVDVNTYRGRVLGVRRG